MRPIVARPALTCRTRRCATPGGALALTATLQLNHDPGYVLQGRVAARPAASPEIADAIKYLGSADAAGLRPFSLAGTF